MFKLKVVIIDDEMNARDALKGILEVFCEEDVEVLGEADSVTTAKALINKVHPDLVFLDIGLGKEHGFDVIKDFASPNFQVIFVTGDNNFAVDAFRVNAVDYLLKPLIPDDLVAAIDKVIRLREKNNIQTHLQDIASALPKNEEDKILIPTSEGMHLVDIEKIMNIEGEGSYSTLFIEDESSSIVASKNLMHYEKLLNSSQFFRAHQSHLVNLNYIKTILPTKNSISLKNGSEIPLSRLKKKELTDLLNMRFKS